jgi:serpin B
MALTGASDDAFAEMVNALSLNALKDRNPINTAMQSLLNSMKKSQDSKVLNVANKIFIDKKFVPNTDFQQEVTTYFNSTSENLDFKNNTEQSRIHINQYVEEKTNNLIKDLIPKGIISADTIVVLVNAIYFKGTWKDKFVKKNTNNQIFRGLTGDTAVPMMTKTYCSVLYGQDQTKTWVKLPYVGDEFNAVFILPRKEDKTSFNKICKDISHTENLLKNFNKCYESELTKLGIPRFELTYCKELTSTMTSLGMKKAFVSGGMKRLGGSSPYISAIVHKAFIKVDEEGTEAAAATAVICDEECEVDEVYFVCDRPFLFLLEHVPSQTIAFAGKVVQF